MEATASTASVEAVNRQLSGSAYKVAVVPVEAVIRLEKNARFMPAEMFKNLVENVRRDGGLTSVPFCVRKGDQYHCLSGNHRIEAAAAAGIKEVLVMYTDEALTREREVAIQLSHNAIAGQDDAAVLKSLWDEIADVGEKYYAGLDDKTLGELEKVAGSGLSPVRLDYRVVSFVFLPEEEQRLDDVFKAALDDATGSDALHLARLPDFDRLLKAIDTVKKEKNVKNSAVALTLILDEWEQSREAAATGA